MARKHYLKLLCYLLPLMLLLTACGSDKKKLSPRVPSMPPSNLGVPLSPMNKALSTGDARYLEGPNVLRRELLDHIDAGSADLRQEKYKLFNLDPDGSEKADGSSLNKISWNLTQNSVHFKSKFGTNSPFLLTNATHNNDKNIVRHVGILGHEKNTSLKDGRYIVLGNNPMLNLKRQDGLNDQMESLMKNMVNWLIHGDEVDHNFSADKPLKVVLTHLSTEAESATHEWLDANFSEKIKYNAENSCDGFVLEFCVNDSPNLIIISHVWLSNQDQDKIDAVVAQIDRALSSGIGVLYLHTHWNISTLGHAVLNHLNSSYVYHNYWSNALVLDTNPLETSFNLPSDIDAIKKLITSLDTPSINFDWSQCQGENCSEVDGFREHFLTGLNKAKQKIRYFDNKKINIFDEDGRKLEKLLILLSDALRQEVRYPMDKQQSNDIDFISALFSDHVRYNFRTTNPAQKDLGIYSRSDFSQVERVEKTLTLSSKIPFRAAGVYALAGQTFKVTRLDENNLKTHVFISTVREPATHVNANYGYNRPQNLQSPHIIIESGESIELTSATGGPIQIQFSHNGLDAQFKFEGVGQHPYWASPEDTETFIQKVQEGLFDWAEISTSTLEIHSTLSKMRTSLRAEGGITQLAENTERYMNNMPYLLAGFKGPNIDVEPSITEFAEQHNLKIHPLNRIQHMNADQAWCGYGCSGNPYDADWHYSPLTQGGDLHELGHSLASGRFLFSDWNGHAISNLYGYFSQYQHFLDTGSAPVCQNLPFQLLFSRIRFSLFFDDFGDASPLAFMQRQDFDDWSWGAVRMIQIFMAAQDQSALENGWHLLPRLHLLDREFYWATRNQQRWSEMRGTIGFGNYDLEAARGISNNDWMAFAISYSLKRDMSEFLPMLGIPLSARAKLHIGSFNFANMEKKLYPSSSQGYCRGLNKTAIEVNKNMTWPGL